MSGPIFTIGAFSLSFVLAYWYSAMHNNTQSHTIFHWKKPSLAALTTTQTSPSLLGGVVIIGGTIIGAGMFFSASGHVRGVVFWSMASADLYTVLCHSGLMILEANLNYRIGSSFDHHHQRFAGQRLERGQRHFHCLCALYPDLCLYFCQWFDSASPSRDVTKRPGTRAAEFGFCIAGSVVVWLSTKAQVICHDSDYYEAKSYLLPLTFGSLLGMCSLRHCSASRQCVLCTVSVGDLPFCLASFGYHGNVPSPDSITARSENRHEMSTVYGTLMALALYTIWLLATMVTSRVGVYRYCREGR